MSETERSGVERMAKQGDDVERSETESPCALALASNTIIYTTADVQIYSPKSLLVNISKFFGRCLFIELYNLKSIISSVQIGIRKKKSTMNQLEIFLAKLDNALQLEILIRNKINSLRIDDFTHSYKRIQLLVCGCGKLPYVR